MGHSFCTVAAHIRLSKKKKISYHLIGLSNIILNWLRAILRIKQTNGVMQPFPILVIMIPHQHHL